MRNRLIVAQIGLWVVIGVLVVSASMAVQAASSGRQRARALANHVATTDELRVDRRRFSEASRRYLLTGDPRDRARVREPELQFKASGARVVASVRQLDGEANAGNVESALAAAGSALAQAMARRPSKDDVPSFEGTELLDAMITFDGQLAIQYRRVDEELEPVQSTLYHEMNAALTRADRVAARAQWTILIVAALSLAIGVTFTITVLRELARQSRQTLTASELAKRVAGARRDLIAASRDLRTPLATIIEHAANLRKTKLRDPEELDALTSIASAAKRVDELLASLLDVSGLQSGTVALRCERCGPDLLIERATRTLGRTANERAIRLRAEASATPVYADPDRIVHVLTMLIELAMTVARMGSEITIGASPTEGAVRFTITSSQTGALPESLAQMFGPNADRDPPQDRPRLEIYLCRRVIEAHGGRMGLELRSGHEASWFELPVEPKLLLT